MTRRTASKYKIDRRVGENIWGRPKSPVNRRSYRPGEHGQRRMGKLSDFGVQLMAKQKLKGHYGDVTERQFRRIYDQAVRRSGNTAENLIGLLESRLDSVVYRAKFVPTIFAARQFVNHGHVAVNGRSARIGSIYLRPGDEVTVGDKGRSMALVLEALESPERDFPPYIDVDMQNMRAVFTHVPELSDVPYPARMEPQLVVEYYSS